VDSQNGNITRVDLKSGLNRSIRPYLSGVKDTKPANLQYRFTGHRPSPSRRGTRTRSTWGGNVVFKSTDGGDRWAAISPDLTRNDKTKQVTSGGPINYDISGAETYNTDPHDQPRTDRLQRDLGRHGRRARAGDPGRREDVEQCVGRFPGLAKDVEGRVYQIGVSPFDAGAAYIAIDATSSTTGGRTSTRPTTMARRGPTSAKGFPPDVPARVVRENPNLRGFLVLGTDAALWYARTAARAGSP